MKPVSGILIGINKINDRLKHISKRMKSGIPNICVLLITRTRNGNIESQE